MKDVLVSYSSRGREDYNTKLLRLIESAAQHWHGNTLFYSPDHPQLIHKGYAINYANPRPAGFAFYPHAEMPYQFKIALIQLALEQGADRVVWLDSSMIIQKDLRPLFGEKGITVFHNLGHPLQNYMADHARDLLNVTDEQLATIPQIWGGALLFDFTKPVVRMLFERIKEFSVNGSFKDGGSTRPGFIAHRHDQAVLSVLLHEKADMLPYGKIKCPPHDTTGEYGNDCYLVCK